MFKQLAFSILLGGVCANGYAQGPPTTESAPESVSTRPSAAQQSPSATEQPGGFKQREDTSEGEALAVEPGTRILLNMINSVSTKQAVVGDRIYLETAFPVFSAGRIVIPQGSWVTGTITDVKRPGRGKGHGELQVRFDSLTLPNGVSRNFNSDLAALDGQSNETLKRENSTISSPSTQGKDTATVASTTAAGTLTGMGLGNVRGHMGMGGVIGAGAGAAAGMAIVLLSRRPDATLTKGSTVEMVLDRKLTFTAGELSFSNAPQHAPLSQGATPAPRQQPRVLPSRLPF